MVRQYFLQGVVTLWFVVFSPFAHSFNPLESLSKALNSDAGQTSRDKAGHAQATGSSRAAQLNRGSASERQVVYEGYAREMLPIKQLIAEGKIDDAIETKKKQYPKPEDHDVLAHLELGALSLDAAKFQEARDHFTHAERGQVEQKDRSTVGGFFSSVRDTTVSTLTGNEELGEYLGPGFERVLMLNYKSIAYMLDGDRNAYNVTRRAIDLQNIEKKKFDEQVRAAEQEISERKKEQQANGNDLQKVGFDAVVEEQYQAADKLAKKVPSAFVNPFGFYMAGVVQELDSYEDKSLRDNARISYQKALELNPNSSVIKQAVDSLKKPPRKDHRLVHVVVGDGFSPEKKLLKFDLSMGLAMPTEIELPIYEPVASKVHRIEVQTTKGKRWAKLSEVADISALALRYQQDASPLAQLRMMTTVIRNVVEGHAWNQAAKQSGLFGGLVMAVKKERDAMVHPDMRAWTTLPSRLLAARFYVPEWVSIIKLIVYDKQGRVLNSRVVKIDKNSHNFVYARTIDETLYTTSSDKMWVGMR